jgi:hypothetical protein
MKLYVIATLVCCAVAQMRHEELLGEAVNFTVSWQANSASDKLHVCYGGEATATDYIGLGFSEANHGMNHSDLVVAYMGADGKPVIKTYFADLFPNAMGGFPNGTSTLEISKTSLTMKGNRMEACFER